MTGGGEHQYQFALRARRHNIELLSGLNNAYERFNWMTEMLREEFNTNRTMALPQYRYITCAIEHQSEEKRTPMEDRDQTEKETLQEAVSALRTHLTGETNWFIEADKAAHNAFKRKTKIRRERRRRTRSTSSRTWHRSPA